MATVITTVTKTASVVKTTKGSEKKWSEILTQNRRHDLQLPLEIAKYDSESKRTFRLYERQKDRAERNRTNRHETWYQDDFLFRNRLLQQLKPITKRFKHVDSLSMQDDQTIQPIFDENQVAIVTFAKTSKEKQRVELPPLQRTKKITFVDETKRFTNPVFSKIRCPKVLHEFEPRLNSHRHSQFLDVAQRFLRRQPEMIEKGIDSTGKQQQNTRVKALIENEQERIRLAALTFGQQLQDEKERETISETDSYY